MIDITLLGTAAMTPTPERYLTAATLSCGGRTILFDCGEGTQTAAREAHVSLMKADLIALTHYHGDHIFGLPGLLQTMSTMGRTEPIYITGPKGLKKELAPIMALTGWVGYPVELMEMPEDGLALYELNSAFPAGARLNAFRTQHRTESQGYCFTLSRPGRFMSDKAKELSIPVSLWSRLQNGETVEADGKIIFPAMVLGQPRSGLKFVFSGDTVPCGELKKWADRADLLISEATYGDDSLSDMADRYGHMTFSQAGQLASEAQVRQLWLCHYSQMIEDPEEFLPNAARFYPGARCGTDGMSATLRFESRG